MSKKLWARITIENLIHEIAAREVNGDYDGGQTLRDVFRRDLEGYEVEIIRQKEQRRKFYATIGEK